VDRPRLIASPSIDLSERSSFRLGKLHVEPLAREVRFDHRSERVEPLVMKVLVALAERRGEVVTRDELIDACWDGRIVGDDVINRAILLLRRIAKASGAFAIETVPKAGYRMTEVQGAFRFSRKLWWAALAVLIVAAGTALLFWLRQRPDQSHPPIAVVELAPFTSTGSALASETARASDSIVADMLTNAGLPVLIPRKGLVQAQPSDLRLSGQVRAVGGQIEADLQLDDLTHGTLLLSRRFSVPAEQARNLPEQMGAFAATSLATTGALMALDRERPGDRRLTGEVLRQWNMMILFEDPISAYQSVERIAGQMPNSAVAQLSLAMITNHVLPLLALGDRMAALTKGRAAAARARALAPNYGDVAWPDCALHSPVRMAECEASLRKAYAVDSDSPFVAAGIRNQLVSVGRFREALAYDRLAVAAMPYMAGRLSSSTMLLESMGLKARAEQRFDQVRRWWPQFDLALGARLEGMLDRGSIEDAAAFVATLPANVDVIDRTGVASIAADVAGGRLQSLRSRCLSRGIPDSLTYFCLVALVRSNDLDGSFQLADRLFPNLMANDPADEDRFFLQSPPGVGLGLGALSAPGMKPLREDPRFLLIVERVGLLRYWRQNHLPDFCGDKPEPVCSMIKRGK